MNVYEIVVDGATPAEDAEQVEIGVYENLCNQAAAVYVQVVSPEILEKIVEIGHPHEMWIYLRGEYYRDTAFALVSQVSSLASLSVTYPSSSSIGTFISQFEKEWVRMFKLAKASTDSYRQLFVKLLAEDKAKRDFLLGFLVHHEKSVVDNLSTKDHLTFAEVKHRLLELDIESPENHSALSSVDKSPLTRRKPTNECTWCRKHHPKSCKGHKWFECKRLKERIERRERETETYENQAHTTTLENNGQVRSDPFYFDTCATSHMCPFADRFESFSICTGLVRSSSGYMMKIKGRGM